MMLSTVLYYSSYNNDQTDLPNILEPNATKIDFYTGEILQAGGSPPANLPQIKNTIREVPCLLFFQDGILVGVLENPTEDNINSFIEEFVRLDLSAKITTESTKFLTEEEIEFSITATNIFGDLKVDFSADILCGGVAQEELANIFKIGVVNGIGTQLVIFGYAEEFTFTTSVGIEKPFEQRRCFNGRLSITVEEGVIL